MRRRALASGANFVVCGQVRDHGLRGVAMALRGPMVAVGEVRVFDVAAKAKNGLSLVDDRYSTGESCFNKHVPPAPAMQRVGCEDGQVESVAAAAGKELVERERREFNRLRKGRRAFGFREPRLHANKPPRADAGVPPVERAGVPWPLRDQVGIAGPKV